MVRAFSSTTFFSFPDVLLARERQMFRKGRLSLVNVGQTLRDNYQAVRYCEERERYPDKQERISIEARKPGNVARRLERGSAPHGRYVLGVPLSTGRISVPIAVILSLLLALVICGGCQQASGEQKIGEPKSKRDGRAEARAGDGAVARAGDAVARAGVNARARAGNAVAKAGSPGGEGNVREVTLEIGGDPETEFSGTCTVGDEKRHIGGRVPERFVYELDGRKLECEIRKHGKDASGLKVVLTAGDDTHVQQIESREATVRIVYSGQGFSSSAIQASSGSATQTITSGSSSIKSSSSTNSR
jgi:hypothetical protein